MNTQFPQLIKNLLLAILLSQFALAPAIADDDDEDEGRNFSSRQLLVTSVQTDLAANEITILGQRLTGRKFKGDDDDRKKPRNRVPEVTLGNNTLQVLNYSSEQITAMLPDGIEAGDYLLTVSAGRGIRNNDSYALTIGAVGQTGPQGEVGPQGPQGEQGAQGIPGPQGPIGLPGPQGEQGPQGELGPQGLAGDDGVQGPKGEKGDKGDKGEQGPRGIIGLTGPTGATGPQGEPGPQGEQGIPGPQGERGLQGKQGLQGEAGPQGEIGSPGPQGEPGPEGIAGVDGGQGPQGLPGIDGLDGINCWDLNSDGINDANEDSDGDGAFNSQDCVPGALITILEELAYLNQRLINSDLDGDGFTPANGDCNDADFDIKPFVQDKPGDGIDNDCDGQVDEEIQIDADGDGYFSIATKGTDCNDDNPDIFPGQSQYFPDSQDYDCNGVIEYQYPVSIIEYVGPDAVCFVSIGWSDGAPDPADCGELATYVTKGGSCSEAETELRAVTCR
ncbi:MAG: MopE-related protein [Gammaproteobacteria bacterium]|nr:MopE-related protein [Gammaproteobacteria bacterium]